MTASTGSAGMTRPMVNVMDVSPMKVSTNVSMTFNIAFTGRGSDRDDPAAAVVFVCDKRRTYLVMLR